MAVSVVVVGILGMKEGLKSFNIKHVLSYFSFLIDDLRSFEIIDRLFWLSDVLFQFIFEICLCNHHVLNSLLRKLLYRLLNLPGYLNLARLTAKKSV